MTAIQRAVVDDLGNINIHGRSGLEIVWKVKDADTNLINISASDLFIEIEGKVRVALTAGEDNYSRKLTLTRAQIATLPINQPLNYALHDETPSSPATIWSGKITAYGFRTAPSGAAAVDPGAASWTGATVTVQQGESVPTVVVTYMGATGYGVPTGGTVGQYLRKNSSTEFDWAFDTITSADVSGLDAQLAALQPLNANLTTIGGLSPSNDDLLQRKAGAWINRTPAQVKADMAIGISDVASLQAALDAKQNLHANLTAFSGLSLVADSLPYANGTGTLAMATLTAAGRAVIGAADEAAQRTALGLGTAAVQNLASMAAMTMAGVLAFIAGTAALPGLAVAGDLNTGIYGVSADVLGVTAGGSQVQSWGVGTSTLTGNLTATGNLSVGIAGAHSTDYGITINNGSYSGSDGYISFKNGATATELARINMNQDGLLNIGTVNVSAFEFKTSNVNRWQITSAGHHLPYADNTYDAGSTALRIRSGYFGTNVVIGYSTTSTAALHVGAGVPLAYANGAGTGTTSQLINSQASGSAALTAGVGNGVNNRRAALFVDQDNAVWGLSALATSGLIPFIISNNGATQFQLSTAGVATLYNNLLNGTDNSYDQGAFGTGRFRTAYFGTSLYVGAASAGFTIEDGVGTTFSPQIQAIPTSGAGAIVAGVLDGTNNRRAALFVDQTNAVWGLSARVTSGAIPFIIRNNSAIHFQLSTAGVATLYNSLAITSGTITASAPALNITQTWNSGGVTFYGLQVAITDTASASGSRLIETSVGGTSVFFVRRDGLVQSNGGFSSATDSALIRMGAASDVVLARDAANTLALRNGANAQELRLYSTYTDASNYARLRMLLSGSTWTFATGQLGTGTATGISLESGGNLSLGSGGTANQWRLSSGNFGPLADATYDLASASLQIRDAYLSRYLKIGGAAPAGASGLATIQAFGNLWAVIGGSVLTDATSKDVYFGSLHYTNTEEPVAGLRIGSSSGENYVYIGGARSNANAATAIYIQTAATTTTLEGNTRWYWNSSGHYLAAADNTYDIGASGASRPRAIYVAGTATIGGNVFAAGDVRAGASGSIYWNGSSVIRSISDGVLALYNNALTGFTGIKFGGLTAASPYLKVNGANLQGRLADDTDFNRFQAKLQTHANAVAETPTATHTLTLYDASGTAYRVLALV